MDNNTACISVVRVAALIATLAVLAACEGSGVPTSPELADPPAPLERPTGTAAQTAQAPTSERPIATSEPGPPAPQPRRFDIRSVPISDAPLGEFPYFTLPDGYANPNRPTPIVDLDRVPFWTGDRLQWVEGQAFQGLIHAVDGKTFSPFEVKKNIGQLIATVGGVMVTDSRIPADVLDTLDDSYTVRYSGAHGDIYNDPVQTYLVRRADGNIWVHLSASSASGGWIIVQSEPFEQTATLLPATKLKQQLDAEGKVAIHVNFATDEAQILPASQPQIDQVVQMLASDPDLKLSINGHTDSTGAAHHNQVLSRERAQAVVAALTDQGIAPSRLRAQGFGATQPVADNATAAGKAANRRVELTRIK